MIPHYVPRQLTGDDGNPTSESDCLAKGGTIVVLAEPGAGKTELLDSFGRALGVTRQRAGIFRHKTQSMSGPALIIDALDEVARQDASALDGVIVKALELKATTTILASRASEWSKERNHFIRDCTGLEPTVLHLQPFNEEEQRQSFESLFPGEDFKTFHTEAGRFGLTPILGNPMFLRLIVGGYIQAGRRIHSKRQIFKDAVDRLATDDGKTTGTAPRPSIDAIVTSASSIFAKLLFSGADGVAIAERPGERQFPYVAALTGDDPKIWQSILNSRLFKPSTDSDNHEPVHRIVAEYCAATYLARRLADTADTLSLKRCLAIMAPNGVPRDDLRGLLGWLAALGSQSVQSTIIALDPYAVIANGDPAQLTSLSKKKLVVQLRSLAKIDPYFRRTDAWRRFNAAGFLTRDIADDLRPVLTAPDDGSHLRDLTLELLRDAPAASVLAAELRSLMLDCNSDLITRLLARRCLAPVPGYDPAHQDFAALIAEGTPDAFQVATEFLTDTPTMRRVPAQLHALLAGLAGPIPPTVPADKRRTNVATARTIVATLDLQTITTLLDNLTAGLACTCAAKHRFECHCRDGVSKIVGILLDRAFAIGLPSLTPPRLWSWLRNLNFHGHKSSDDSPAVKALRDDHALRQAVHRLAFTGLTTSDAIWQMRSALHGSHLHAGLTIFREDVEALADHALASDDVTLWSALAPVHDTYEKTKGPNLLRQKFRGQAKKNAAFLKEWTKFERRWREQADQYRERSRSLKRRRRRDADVRSSDRAHLAANRSLIEQGNHWGWLRGFAHDHLHFPDKLKDFDDGVIIAENALDNCFAFVAPHVPTLAELAQRKGAVVAEVLHAACRVRFRRTGSLASINLDVLRAAKTDLAKCATYAEGEFERLEAEIDARIFPTLADVEQFARAFVEPTVMPLTAGSSSNLWWLSGKSALERVKAKLAAEWLDTYSTATLDATRTLFDIAADTAERAWLVALIERRCNACLAISRSSETPDQAACREFWFLRHFFFAASDRAGIWADVLCKPNGIFSIEEHSGWLYRSRSTAWPSLNAAKIHKVLDAYVGVWPKVYLPGSWGSDSPCGERAYRFLTEIVSMIEQDPEHTRAISVVDRLLADARFTDFANRLRSAKAVRLRKLALADYAAPAPHIVSELFGAASVATVEDLRALLLEELERIQAWLHTETDPLEIFWPGGARVNENTARNRIVERLQLRFQSLDAAVVIEHHMADGNRCDFTVTKILDNHRRLLVCEVKGQWHPELFTAAAEQLDKRYASHPDAARQGIYLALWFGQDEKVADRKRHQIATAQDLKAAIVEKIPPELHGFIDVLVLDLSKP